MCIVMLRIYIFVYTSADIFSIKQSHMVVRSVCIKNLQASKQTCQELISVHHHPLMAMLVSPMERLQLILKWLDLHLKQQRLRPRRQRRRPRQRRLRPRNLLSVNAFFSFSQLQSSSRPTASTRQRRSCGSPSCAPCRVTSTRASTR